MKKLSLIILLLPFILVGCKSKEEKAAELIKNELSKTLYDFDSYEPIETTVQEAKLSAFTDTTCWNKALVLVYIFNKSNELLEEANDAKEHMDIWGPPSYYSSTYSDNKYYKYRDEYKDKLADAIKYYEIVKIGSKELKDSINALDTDIIIGWEVKHRFRCKTRGGNSTIGDYRYVLDKDFKNVIIVEDTDDSDYTRIREMIDASLDGTFDEES